MGKSDRKNKGRAPSRNAPPPAPWYKKRTGQVVGLGALLLVALVLFLTVGGSDKDYTVDDVKGVERMSSQIEDLTVALRDPGDGMAQALSNPPEDVGEQAETWLEQLDEANEIFVAFDVPQELDEAQVVFGRMLDTYYEVAEITQSAALVEESEARNQLLQHADDLRYIADQLLLVGTTLTDQRRLELDLHPIGVE